MNRSALAAVLAVATIGLAGCVPAPVERNAADFVGTWLNGDTTLILSADGTFTLTDAPEYTLFTSDASWRDDDGTTRDGCGEWNVTELSLRLDNTCDGGYAGEQLFYEEQLLTARTDVIYFGLDLGSEYPMCFELVREGSDREADGPSDCGIRP